MTRRRRLRRWQRRALTVLSAVVAVVLVAALLAEDERTRAPMPRGAPAAGATGVAASAGDGTAADAPEAPPGASSTRGEDPTEPGPPRVVRPVSTSDATGIALTGAVTDVVDGDTVKVEVDGFETTVRLVGIDAPETRHPSTPVQCFGAEASERVARILPAGERVRLEGDATQETRDRYGRLLAYVYRGGRQGARGSVNYALVATGYARAYVHGGVPFRYAPDFVAAERAAEDAGRGLWGPPCRGDTEQPAVESGPAAVTGSPSPAPAPPLAEPPPGPGGGGGYSPPVPPYPPDLDCADVDGPIRVTGGDPHGLDGDGDGRACEG